MHTQRPSQSLKFKRQSQLHIIESFFTFIHDGKHKLNPGSLRNS